DTLDSAVKNRGRSANGIMRSWGGGREPKTEEKPEKPMQLPQDLKEKDARREAKPRELYVAYLQETKEPKKEDKSKPKPVNIMAFGNRIVITSEDAEALREVNAIVQLVTRTQDGEGDFEVIKLQHATAADVAKIRDEWFNGTKPQNQQPGGGFPQFPGGGNPFRFRFDTGPPATPAPGTPGSAQAQPRVRVVADPATNSI